MGILILLNLGLYRVLPPAQRELYLAPARTFRLEFDVPYMSIGWYGTETSAIGETYKWTRRHDATLTLPLMNQQDDLELKLRLVYLQSPDSLRIAANETDIPLTRNGTEYQGIIPASALIDSDEITLHFITDSMHIPGLANLASQDYRSLGVAVDWLILQPITRPGVLYEFDPLTPVGTNWYGTEVDESSGMNFRWTSALSADLPVDQLPTGVPLRIEVGVNSTFVPDALDSFSLALDGETLALTRTAREGRTLFEAEASPRTVQTGTFTFSVDSVGSPLADGRGNDDRILGIQVDWLRITPLGID